jgi:hypothetical protein
LKVRAALSGRVLVESGKPNLRKERTAVRKGYQIASKKDSGRLRQFLAQQGQALLPMVELIEQGRLAVEELVHDLGRAALEAVLLVSAEQVAGPPHPGKPAGALGERRPTCEREG